MIDPPRLSSFGGDASDLLRSAHDDGPSAEARRRTAAALGIALATTTAGALAVTTLTSAKAATIATGASIGSKTGAVGGTALVIKVIGATLVCSVLAVGAVAVVKPEAFFPRASETVPATELASNATNANAANAANGAKARTTTAPPALDVPSASSALAANDIELAATPPSNVAANAPAARPVQNAQMAQSTPSAGNLDGEVSALDGARTKLAAGDGAGALAALDVYKRTFPNGVLAPESTVLRIEALHASGDDFKARSLGEAFLAAHPNSPQARRVRSVLDRMARTPEN